MQNLGIRSPTRMSTPCQWISSTFLATKGLYHVFHNNISIIIVYPLCTTIPSNHSVDRSHKLPPPSSIVGIVRIILHWIFPFHFYRHHRVLPGTPFIPKRCEHVLLSVTTQLPVLIIIEDLTRQQQPEYWTDACALNDVPLTATLDYQQWVSIE